MSFCGELATALTDSDLNATFGSMEQPGLLPAEGFPPDRRDQRGLLKPDVLASAVTSFIAAGKIPKPPKIGEATPSSTEAYMKKDRAFVERLKQEYCFYDARYRYSLKQLIAKLQAGYTDANQQNAQLIQTYLKATQGLNQRLNDLTQLCNEISKQRLQSTRDQNSNINYLNSQLQERSQKLNEQNKILSSEQATALLYKDMVKYTKEKADSVNNLLSMYSFMNVVVLGLLVYLYRSASTE